MGISDHHAGSRTVASPQLTGTSRLLEGPWNSGEVGAEGEAWIVAEPCGHGVLVAACVEEFPGLGQGHAETCTRSLRCVLGWCVNCEVRVGEEAAPRPAQMLERPRCAGTVIRG